MNITLWEKAIEFHGHKCKGLALGFRMGEEAKKIFGTSDEIACILPGRNCITDGITGSIGASEENGRVRIDSSVNKFVFYLPEEEEGWAFTYKNIDLPLEQDPAEMVLKAGRDFLFTLEPWEL